MRPIVSNLLWLAPASALVLPPFLLIPLVFSLPAAQLFKDFYEACLWISPAVGVTVLALIWRWKRAGAITLGQPAVSAGIVLACLDLLSPMFFYVLLALLAGR